MQYGSAKLVIVFPELNDVTESIEPYSVNRPALKNWNTIKEGDDNNVLVEIVTAISCELISYNGL